MAPPVHAILLLLLTFNFYNTQAGSTCPSPLEIYPCYCTTIQEEGGYTLVICPHIANSSELESVIQPMKSLIIDRLLMLNTFLSEDKEDKNRSTDLNRRLPNKWLASVRVKELEFQHGFLSNCFLCNDPLSGQSDFLTSITATHCNLEGHLCSICNSRSDSTSTRELQKAPKIRTVDLSGNSISIIDGFAFPPTMRELRKVVLSDNKINRIHDNAFASLIQLSEIDLSKNQLTTISRKMFKPTDTTLRTLDLSWNSLSSLPEDMFINMLSLRDVRLSYNLLEVLPVDTWLKVPNTIDRIDVRGNFLVCNCSISWISQYLGKVSKIMGKCVAPKEVELMELKGVANSVVDSCSV